MCWKSKRHQQTSKTFSLRPYIIQHTNPQTPLLEGRNIGRRHPGGETWLLREASLALQAGQALAIVGVSGSGKTLLLRALAGLDPLDEGEILWHGQPVRGRAAPQFRSHVVYLPQRPSLIEGTAEDNLRWPFQFKIHRRGQFDRQSAIGSLARLGREEAFLAKSSDHLSGGEAQITALLRAMQLDAEALLLDEPTAALDSQAAIAVERLVKDWLKEQPSRRAVIWVSHNLSQAKGVGDRLLTMHQGRLSETSADVVYRAKPVSSDAGGAVDPD